MQEKIAVVGAGSWGTALAKLLGDKGEGVLLWAFEEEVVGGINARHVNPLYLSDVVLPKTVRATGDLKEALAGRRIVISAVPSHALRRVWESAAPALDEKALLVSCTKGIEADNFKLMSQVLSECLPKHPPARRTVLSGPSFAREVAAGLPTSVVVAGRDPAACRTIQEALRTDAFLTFTNDDVVGVEVGGAVKNVIAIATGISDGLGFGYNSRAATITRGLYEMIKIGRALGANPLTFAGLSGIGDLVLTCTAKLSRNHTVGEALGKGQSLEAVLSKMTMVAEGVPTTKAVRALARAHGIRAPICDSVFRILFEGLPPRQAVEELCAMELTDELSAILKQ